MRSSISKNGLSVFVGLTFLVLLIFISIGNTGCTRVSDEPMPIADSIRVGLVAHYPLGISPADLTGNNPDLEVINGSVRLSGRANQFNEYATFFSGTSNSFARLYLTNSRAVKGELTIAFWAKEMGPGTFSPRVFEFWPGNYGVGFFWFNWYQGKVKWAGADFAIEPDSIFQRRQWYHFVLMQDVGAIQFYCNGKRIARITSNGNIPPAAIQLASYAELGRLAQRPADAFEGGIMDFRIYNRILSQREIEYIYTQ
ncbi:MAG: LamG domain-containing protein [Chitinophagaceae bacterium]|nr:LamG domain-containing protein [Chitinophagaceae bacterium]